MFRPAIASTNFLHILMLDVVVGLAVALPARADPASLSSKDASSGLKEALTRGAEFAVTQLGKPDGFLANAKVKIRGGSVCRSLW